MHVFCAVVYNSADAQCFFCWSPVPLLLLLLLLVLRLTLVVLLRSSTALLEYMQRLQYPAAVALFLRHAAGSCALLRTQSAAHRLPLLYFSAPAPVLVNSSCVLKSVLVSTSLCMFGRFNSK
jgi:hypothetical protein